jgi:hypothetical protein
MCTEYIMRVGGWGSLDRALRYTRSIKSEDSLRLCRRLEALSTDGEKELITSEGCWSMEE